jgi:hypothetical protein
MTKTTQIWGFSKLRVKIKKKSVISTYSIFQHVYGKHNLVSFYGRIVFWQKNCIVVFYIILGGGFQEETLGDISFRLQTKIMNFTTVFFYWKKYNQAQVLSILCNAICLQFSHYQAPLQSLGLFYWLHHVFQILSVILTNYHYIILTGYPRSNFLNYINYNEFTWKACFLVIYSSYQCPANFGKSTNL